MCIEVGSSSVGEVIVRVMYIVKFIGYFYENSRINAYRNLSFFFLLTPYLPFNSNRRSKEVTLTLNFFSIVR